jgi:hypothetical protein
MLYLYHTVFVSCRETDARVPLMIHDPSAPQTFGKTTMSLVEHVGECGHLLGTFAFSSLSNGCIHGHSDLYPTTVEMAMGTTVDKRTESIEGRCWSVLPLQFVLC